MVWLLIQSAALVAALLRLPLSAAYPRNGEQLAAQVILATQFTAAALLFPYLMRTRGTALAVIAASWPFVVLGGVFSAVTGTRILACMVYLATWLAALWAWRAAAGAQVRYAVAIFLLLTFGSPAVHYLKADFISDPAADAQQAARSWPWLCPPLAVVRTLSGPFELLTWALPISALATALAVWSLRRAQRTGYPQFGSRPDR